MSPWLPSISNEERIMTKWAKLLVICLGSVVLRYFAPSSVYNYLIRIHIFRGLRYIYDSYTIVVYNLYVDLMYDVLTLFNNYDFSLMNVLIS